jgi:hypothetical protein
VFEVRKVKEKARSQIQKVFIRNQDMAKSN